MSAPAALLLKLSAVHPCAREVTLPAPSAPCGQLAAAASTPAKGKNLHFSFRKYLHSDTDGSCRCPALHGADPSSAQIAPGAISSSSNHPRAATGRVMQLL